MAERSDDARFDLFISYATDPDYALARQLESFLEAFHQLPNPGGVALRPLRVCVDGSDFHSQNDLGVTLEGYLARCDALLVLGSANARSSRWVNDEVSWFLDHRPGAVRVALTEGNDPAHAENVLPPPLIEAGFHHRIAYDFRGAKRGAKERWRAVRDLDDERTRLAADLYGRSSGEIQPIWFREQQHKARTRLRAVTGTAVVLFVLLVFAVYYFLAARAEARRAWRQSYIASTNLALRAWSEGAIDLAKETLDAQIPDDGQEDLRDFDWLHAHRRVTAERRRWFVDKVAFETVDVSRDGSLVAAGGRLWGEAEETNNPARLVFVWSMRDGKTVAVLAGHEEEVAAVAFSPTRPILASAGDDAVRIWDLTTKRQLRALAVSFGSALAFSPDGNTLAILEGDRVVLVDTRTWSERNSRFVTEASTLVYAPDGKRIAVAAEAGVEVLDATTLATTRTEAVERPSALAWSGSNVLAIGHGRELTLIREGGSLPSRFEVERPVGSLAFSRDGEILAIGAGDRTDLTSGGSIELFDLRAQASRGVLRGDPRRRVFSMAMTPDGGLVSAGEEETVRVWDLEKGSFLHGVAFDSDTPIWSMAFSNDGKKLIAADGEGQLHIAPIRGGAAATVRAHAQRFDIALSSEGVLATAGVDGKVMLWPKDGPNRVLHENAATPLMTSVAFSPDARTLAAGNCDGTIRFWRAPAYAAPVVRKQPACAGFLAWSPDSHVVVSGGGDPANERAPHSVFVWNPAGDEPREVLEGHRSWPRAAAFSHDGALLVTGDWSGELILWNARTWKRKLPPMRGHGDVIVGVAFTPSGKAIVSTSRDGTVRIWDVVTGQQRAVLADAGGSLFASAMTPGGDILAAATERGHVVLWLAEGATLARSRGVVSSH